MALTTGVDSNDLNEVPVIQILKGEKMKNSCTTNLLMLVVLFAACYAGAAVIYVDDSATAGANNGSSWTDAYLYLQDAISAAAAGDQIWVAAGTYTPDKSNANPTGSGDRAATFILKNLVEIHGGFEGTETLLDQRQTNVDGAYINITYLSGDLLGDDEPSTLVQDMLTDTTRAENSYHVITGTLCGPPTILEGITVIAGQANGADELGKGGGWYNITNSSPTVEKCIFTRNAAQTRGGAWYNEGANCRPTLTGMRFTTNYCADRGGAVAMLNSGSGVQLDECTFSSNYANNHGGSIYLDQSSPTIINNTTFSSDYAANGGSLSGVGNSAPTITNASFTSNTATNGGAMRADSCQFEINKSQFVDNTTTGSGGTCYFSGGQSWFNTCDFDNNHAGTAGGAIYNTSCNVIYNDCRFLNNTSAGAGGAVYTKTSSPQFGQCIFYNNSSATSGGAIYNFYTGHPKVTNTSFIGNHSASYGGAICNQPDGLGTRIYLTCYNTIFTGNYVVGSGADGGAVANLHIRYTSTYSNTSTTFISCTVYGNSAIDKGGGIYTDHSNSTNTLRNCILHGNADTAGGNNSESAQIHYGSNTVQYSCIQNISTYTGNGNIGDDPSFVDPLGPDWIGGTLDDNLRLSAGSPCIDAANGAMVPADLLTDLDGYARCQDDPATVDTGIVATNPPHDPNGIPDMGAYEFLAICQPAWCDAKLKAAVEQALGITDPTCSEMLNLTSLDIQNKEITCLDGLEYAANLTYLRAHNNQIVDLTPLADCTKLQTLYLYSNNIVDISPLCNLTKLTYLHLAYNEITEIPSCLCNLNLLRSLFLYNNPIDDLCPTTCFTALRTFYIYNIETLPLNAYQVCIPQIKANNASLTDFRYDTGCEPPLTADFNQDCIVNLLDFAQMCDEWLECTHMYPEMCP